MRLHPLNWIQWLTLALAVCVATTTPILYFRITHVQEHQNDALSAIICHAEHLIRVSKGLTPQQRSQAVHFYEQQIRLEHLKPCD